MPICFGLELTYSGSRQDLPERVAALIEVGTALSRVRLVSYLRIRTRGKRKREKLLGHPCRVMQALFDKLTRVTKSARGWG
jgi:hypothetical protein